MLRHEDHRASVKVENGSLVEILGELNINKTNKILRYTPDNAEVVSLYKHRHLFENLEFVDLLLTNACNLSCTYCYEQHNKDVGRFTTQTIKQVWDWLLSINDLKGKYLQFFGGEPLIHKKLILDFLRENREEVMEKAAAGIQTVSITTNGLLLTDEFLDEYFSIPGVKMMISLDTTDWTKDHRGITETQMATLLNTIEKVAKRVSDPKNLAIRATIGREVAGQIKEFWTELYRRGARQLIFHPLILSYGQGYIEWNPEEWHTFTSDIRSIIQSSRDMVYFQVAEGVGTKGKTNCLVGSDEIAVDASGDFSGCYFFTNRKVADTVNTSSMLIGNIFDDQLYLDRYIHFRDSYEHMYDENEECKTCNVRNLCYQCPAGNLATSGKLYKADGMCKRFIELYDEMGKLTIARLAARSIIELVQKYKDQGDVALTREVLKLMWKFFHGMELQESTLKLIKDTHYGGILAYWCKCLEGAKPSKNVDKVLAEAAKLPPIPAVILFTELVDRNMPNLTGLSQNIDVSYIGFLGQVIDMYHLRSAA
jgi:radical SAM protein with 4Fe4S-binding SPASM domain